MNKNYCIVTTINTPTKSIEKLHELFGENLIVIGDKKTPEDWQYKNATYFSLEAQNEFAFSSKYYTPQNHYARKNIGYLLAIRYGADLIYSVDDDNCPNEEWTIRNKSFSANISDKEGWFNVYRFFSNENISIWPRGFSLKYVKKYPFYGKINVFESSIQQGLADGEPDVDAIWRLTKNQFHTFNYRNSLYLNKNTWCPFNTQSTWFFPKAFPLLYLPVHATMRCCDIWSSFVGQRCLWEVNDGVAFHSPSEVFQQRNEHDLLKDFEDEIPGYLKNDLIVETLQNLSLKKGEENICDNLFTCYEALCEKDILPYNELRSVSAWIKDYKNITNAK